MSTALLEEPAPQAQPEGLGKERHYHYRERLHNLMRLDFEMLNAALGVELNTQMSPLVMQAVLRRRIGELTAEERRGLPEIVIEVVLAIDGDHMAKTFSKYLKDKPRTKEPVAKSETPPPAPKETVVEKILPGPVMIKESKPDRVRIIHVEGGVTVNVEGMKPADILKHLISTKPWVSWCFYNGVQALTTPDALTLISTMFSEFNGHDIRTLFREKFDL